MKESGSTLGSKRNNTSIYSRIISGFLGGVLLLAVLGFFGWGLVGASIKIPSVLNFLFYSGFNWINISIISISCIFIASTIISYTEHQEWVKIKNEMNTGNSADQRNEEQLWLADRQKFRMEESAKAWIDRDLRKAIKAFIKKFPDNGFPTVKSFCPRTTPKKYYHIANHCEKFMKSSQYNNSQSLNDILKVLIERLKSDIQRTYDVFNNNWGHDTKTLELANLLLRTDDEKKDFWWGFKVGKFMRPFTDQIFWRRAITREYLFSKESDKDIMDLHNDLKRILTTEEYRNLWIMYTHMSSNYACVNVFESLVDSFLDQNKNSQLLSDVLKMIADIPDKNQYVWLMLIGKYNEIDYQKGKKVDTMVEKLRKCYEQISDNKDKDNIVKFLRSFGDVLQDKKGLKEIFDESTQFNKESPDKRSRLFCFAKCKEIKFSEEDKLRNAYMDHLNSEEKKCTAFFKDKKPTAENSGLWKEPIRPTYDNTDAKELEKIGMGID